MRTAILVLLTFIALTGDAMAYVGPGLGLGIIGAIISGVLAVLLAIVGLIWYPLKRLMKRKRSPSDSEKEEIRKP